MSSHDQNKSTNVRTKNWGLRALRTGLRLVSPASPALAARWAEPLFFRVPRHPRPAWEVAVLEGASAHYLVPFLDTQLPVWTWGTGPVVLLVHGWAGRGSQLGAFVQPLVDAGFRVAVMDGPGHGDNQARSCSLPELADAIRAVAATLGPLHGLLAHSMGAASAVLAASRGLDVARVALVAPPSTPVRYTHDFATMLGLDDEVLRQIQKRVEARLDVAFSDLDVPTLARDLRARLLVIHDADDRDVPLADGRAIAAAAPDARLMVTSGLGHRRVLRDPSVLQQTVSFFHRESRAPGSPHVLPMADLAPLQLEPPWLDLSA